MNVFPLDRMSNVNEIVNEISIISFNDFVQILHLTTSYNREKVQFIEK